MRAPSFGPSPLARRAMRLGLQHSEATNSSGELRDDDHVPQQRDPRPKTQNPNEEGRLKKHCRITELSRQASKEQLCD